MPIFTLSCVILIIAVITGLFDPVSHIRVRGFELIMLCVCALALSSFTLSPFPEIELNVAVIALPLLLAAFKGSAPLYVAAYFALAPFALVALGCVLELVLIGYTAFYACEDVLNMQAASALCAAIYISSLSKTPRVSE